MQFKKITFSAAEQEELRLLLEKQEGIPIQCRQEMSGVWYHSEDWETELRILFLANLRVTVSRVCFIRKRVGTMTQVEEFLERFCRRHGIPEVLVQSVETTEMAAWCIKNGFTVSPVTSIELDGVKFGDYMKMIIVCSDATAQ